MIRGVLILLLSHLSFFSLAQGTLSLDQFIDLITLNHPIAQQSEIAKEMGDAELRKARGGFDPKLYSSNSTKDFEGTNYFNLNNSGVKIPTWLGIEVKAGYLYNEGYYVNPENNVTGNGLTYAGITVPVGKGLFIDERRANLRKAQLIQDQSKEAQKIILNDLYQEAIIDYLDWSYNYTSYTIYDAALAVTKRRLENVKTSFVIGELAAVDTLEASIQVQNRLVYLNEIKLDLINSRNKLSSHIWSDNGDLVLLKDSVAPEILDSLMFVAVPDSVLLSPFPEDHPELMMYKYKIGQLEIDKRYKAEMLKPTLDLKYQALRRDLGYTGFILDENYKYGFSFEFPVLLRKERGALDMAKLKLRDTEFDTDLKRASLLTKYQTAQEQLNVYKAQWSLTELNYNSYAKLLDVENQKFRIGESSLYMVNSRETKMLDANSKKLKAINKYYASQLKLLYAGGSLYQYVK